MVGAAARARRPRRHGRKIGVDGDQPAASVSRRLRSVSGSSAKASRSSSRQHHRAEFRFRLEMPARQAAIGGGTVRVRVATRGKQAPGRVRCRPTCVSNTTRRDHLGVEQLADSRRPAGPASNSLHGPPCVREITIVLVAERQRSARVCPAWWASDRCGYYRRRLRCPHRVASTTMVVAASARTTACLTRCAHRARRIMWLTASRAVTVCCQKNGARGCFNQMRRWECRHLRFGVRSFIPSQPSSHVGHVGPAHQRCCSRRCRRSIGGRVSDRRSS